ncbi:Fe-S protein assembly co-chaperone HscB [Cryptococcus bacillisporus CA1280]|uniref:Fe-S protein assembly co-chaperone HscB n=2 Tax=Cryptococcus gattii TaxID=552467 RepID=A0A0D0TLI5_CRYGA|nr:Fe-S protein assembly co-chaperone HscB [Cryptococcus bacillisporus CA1280]KIR62508.1 Fe-S protein assembly co-chaperone HscB [Cryptococcus bacillisporus CA1873]|eukprot:KIR62508.1 Fe-S protein assembly co-chaperone HscB [Cryptococcus gattii CA1873]
MILRVPPRPLLRPFSLSRPATRFAHFAPQAPTRNCPTCSRPVPLPLSPCPSCSSVLPLPSNLSHHSMLYLSSPISSSGSPAGPFDIPQELAHLPANGYIVDKADLRSNWVRRQRELHPDKYTTRGDVVVDRARELSGRVNEAYAVLGDDLRRAEYILSVNAQGTEETDKIDDPMLLAEILEAREELEEAETPEQVDRIRQANIEHVKGIVGSLEQAFSGTPPDLAEAKLLAVQLRYWMNLEKAAKEKSI